MIRSETHKVKSLNSPIRLQDYAVGIFPSCPSKSGLKKQIKKGNVTVNGKRASTAMFIRGGEKIVLTLKDLSDHKPLDFKLEVIYEDDHLAAIFKPPGIAVHGNKHRTISSALSSNLKESNEQDACYPKPVHRLDYPTSGLLLVGKTASSVRRLNQMFERKEISKTYLAVCIGTISSEGESNELIENKNAHTSWRVIDSKPSENYGQLNLIELTPTTGRRHQLRIHLSSIGNPILGDRDYSPEELLLKGKGLYLHGYGLRLKHPTSSEIISLKTEIPNKFLKIFPDQATLE